MIDWLFKKKDEDNPDDLINSEPILNGDEYVDKGVLAHRETECPGKVAPGACIHPTSETTPGGNQTF